MPLCEIDGIPPRLDGSDHWIAPNAFVIGNVTLGHGAGVWFAETVRGDNEPIEIGARSNIQEGAFCIPIPNLRCLLDLMSQSDRPS